MKVLDYKKYAKFDYTSNECDNIFQLGEIVTLLDNVTKEPCTNDKGVIEIGVILQIHDENELRTDMFGNADVDNLRLSTLREITRNRVGLLLDVEKIIG
jgi:hypothetical protein